MHSVFRTLISPVRATFFSVSERTLILAISFLPIVAFSQVPGDKIVPPDSLFGDKYNRTYNEPEWNSYLEGEPLDLSESHIAMELSFTNAPLATLLIIAYPDEAGAVANFEDGRTAMEEQTVVKLSPVQELENGKFFTSEVLGRHMCSMVISNVHFVINDPGGILPAATVMEWSNRYADFLRKSISDGKGGGKPELQKTEKWTGSNGTEILGTVKALNRGRDTVDFVTEKGQSIPSLPLNRFSEADREKILKRFPE